MEEKIDHVVLSYPRNQVSENQLVEHGGDWITHYCEKSPFFAAASGQADPDQLELGHTNDDQHNDLKFREGDNFSKYQMASTSYYVAENILIETRKPMEDETELDDLQAKLFGELFDDSDQESQVTSFDQIQVGHHLESKNIGIFNGQETSIVHMPIPSKISRWKKPKSKSSRSVLEEQEFIKDSIQNKIRREAKIKFNESFQHQPLDMNDFLFEVAKRKEQIKLVTAEQIGLPSYEELCEQEQAKQYHEDENIDNIDDQSSSCESGNEDLISLEIESDRDLLPSRFENGISAPSLINNAAFHSPNLPSNQPSYKEKSAYPLTCLDQIEREDEVSNDIFPSKQSPSYSNCDIHADATTLLSLSGEQTFENQCQSGDEPDILELVEPIENELDPKPQYLSNIWTSSSYRNGWDTSKCDTYDYTSTQLPDNSGYIPTQINSMALTATPSISNNLINISLGHSPEPLDKTNNPYNKSPQSKVLTGWLSKSHSNSDSNHDSTDVLDLESQQETITNVDDPLVDYNAAPDRQYDDQIEEDNLALCRVHSSQYNESTEEKEMTQLIDFAQGRAGPARTHLKRTLPPAFGERSKNEKYPRMVKRQFPGQLWLNPTYAKHTTSSSSKKSRHGETATQLSSPAVQSTVLMDSDGENSFIISSDDELDDDSEKRRNQMLLDSMKRRELVQQSLYLHSDQCSQSILQLIEKTQAQSNSLTGSNCNVRGKDSIEPFHLTDFSLLPSSSTLLSSEESKQHLSKLQASFKAGNSQVFSSALLFQHSHNENNDYRRCQNDERLE